MQVLKTYSRLNPTVNAVFSPTNFDQNGDSFFDSDVSNDYLGISLNISSRSQILGRSLETQIESEPLGMSFEIASDYSVQSSGTCQKSVFNSSSQIQLFESDLFSLNEETVVETADMRNAAHYVTSTPVKQISEAYTSDSVYFFSSSPVTPISNSLKSKNIDIIDNSTLSEPETDVDSMSLGVVPLNSSSNMSEPTNSNIDCDMLADIRGIIPIKTSKEVRVIESGKTV
ncbi:unnamed protein product [Mytilus edulis]|uniref:Uncharacterized protein n=1 Tax=Mytilus edulis TaxID=6550 RepID=A0A8S3TNY3_MYTED|nr:unnamed protein product [Mytilus edulis]